MESTYSQQNQLENNKTIAAGFYSEIINKNNLDVIGDYLTDDFTHNGVKMGIDGQKAVVKMFLAAFSGLVNTIEFSIAEGDMVAVHETWTGKHTGDFMGVPASGKNITWTSTAILKIRGNKISEAWDENDFLGLFQMIGRYPEIK